LFREFRDRYTSNARAHSVPASQAILSVVFREFQRQDPFDNGLSFYFNGELDDVGLMTLLQICKSSPHVRGLSLVQPIPTAVIPYFVELISHSSVCSLSVTDSGLTAEAVGRLASALSLSSLTSLDLSGNPIGDAGIQVLASTIMAASKSRKPAAAKGAYCGIRELLLANTGCTDAGAASIAELLVTSPSVVVVDLRDNEIGSPGAVLLSRVLSVAHGFEVLALGGAADSADAATAEAVAKVEEIGDRNAFLHSIVDNIVSHSCDSAVASEAAQSRAKAPKSRPGAAGSAVRSPANIASVEEERQSLQELSLRIAYAETIGRRLDMEDVVLVRRKFRGNPNESLFAVFDGHGGRESAELAAEMLPRVLADRLSALCGDATPSSKAVEQAFAEAFAETNRQITLCDVDDGTTALVAYLIGTRLIVSNLGDTRAVICRNGKAIRLSYDHKPELPEEEARIRALGGFVEAGRVLGALSVARALGDVFLHPYVSCEPFTRIESIGPKDSFVILACDGLWDKLSDEDAVQIVLRGGNPVSAAIRLRDEAFVRGSTDNISVVVLVFSSA
jgi:serine/threonine protein phosphatase PrpC